MPAQHPARLIHRIDHWIEQLLHLLIDNRLFDNEALFMYTFCVKKIRTRGYSSARMLRQQSILA
jgi:hypothetical protein